MDWKTTDSIKGDGWKCSRGKLGLNLSLATSTDKYRINRGLFCKDQNTDSWLLYPSPTQDEK